MDSLASRGAEAASQQKRGLLAPRASPFGLSAGRSGTSSGHVGLLTNLPSWRGHAVDEEEEGDEGGALNEWQMQERAGPQGKQEKRESFFDQDSAGASSAGLSGPSLTWGWPRSQQADSEGAGVGAGAASGAGSVTGAGVASYSRPSLPAYRGLLNRPTAGPSASSAGPGGAQSSTFHSRHQDNDEEDVEEVEAVYIDDDEDEDEDEDGDIGDVTDREEGSLTEIENDGHEGTSETRSSGANAADRKAGVAGDRPSRAAASAAKARIKAGSDSGDKTFYVKDLANNPILRACKNEKEFNAAFDKIACVHPRLKMITKRSLRDTRSSVRREMLNLQGGGDITAAEPGSTEHQPAQTVSSQLAKLRAYVLEQTSYTESRMNPASCSQLSPGAGQVGLVADRMASILKEVFNEASFNAAWRTDIAPLVLVGQQRVDYIASLPRKSNEPRSQSEKRSTARARLLKARICQAAGWVLNGGHSESDRRLSDSGETDDDEGAGGKVGGSGGGKGRKQPAPKRRRLGAYAGEEGRAINFSGGDQDAAWLAAAGLDDYLDDEDGDEGEVVGGARAPVQSKGKGRKPGASAASQNLAAGTPASSASKNRNGAFAVMNLSTAAGAVRPSPSAVPRPAQATHAGQKRSAAGHTNAAAGTPATGKQATAPQRAGAPKPAASLATDPERPMSGLEKARETLAGLRALAKLVPHDAKVKQKIAEMQAAVDALESEY